MKLIPSYGVVALPDTEKALEGDDDESDLATHLFDDQAFDLADVMPLGVVDRRAFDAIALDKALSRCG
jgi:hypothetical protein